MSKIKENELELENHLEDSKDKEFYEDYITALQGLFAKGEMAIVACEEHDTGEVIPVLCSLKIGQEDQSVELVPFAYLFKDNPYEKVSPVSHDEKAILASQAVVTPVNIFGSTSTDKSLN